MRQELIDLLRGELDPAEAVALRARVAAEPALARELLELESLLGLLHRSEQLEPAPATRALVLSAARPSVFRRVAAIPGLVRYRLRHSVGFRVAAVSVAVHLIGMAVLFQVAVGRPSEPEPPEFELSWLDPARPVEPEPGFQLRLRLRRAPHAPALRLYGAAGHDRAIERQLSVIVASQRPDGSFGDVEETAVATLGLLAEGDCSVLPTERGRAIAAASRRLRAAVEAGATHGAILAALVEDYVLSYEGLDDLARADYVRAIQEVLRRVGDDAFSGEALALARMAGFVVPEGKGLVFDEVRRDALGRPPTRVAVTAVLARGRTIADPEAVRLWALPLFEAAVHQIEAGEGSAESLLTLQAPYRL
jgi:hypothetical protein